jgi:hypothetical protein
MNKIDKGEIRTNKNRKQKKKEVWGGNQKA